MNYLILFFVFVNSRHLCFRIFTMITCVLALEGENLACRTGKITPQEIAYAICQISAIRVQLALFYPPLEKRLERICGHRFVRRDQRRKPDFTFCWQQAP